MLITGAMFLLGLLLGFIGVGGAGVVIAILTIAFGVPVHMALGTSLGAMGFTTLSGTFSHFRENNVVLRCGLIVGLFGAIGSYLGVKIATLIPDHDLVRLTGYVMLLSAVLMWIRMSVFSEKMLPSVHTGSSGKGVSILTSSCIVGTSSGILSGTFGVGAAPFIQLGLLHFFKLSLPQVAGTTMLVTLPIAFTGGLGYLLEGHLDLLLFIEVVIGLMSGTYIGAKFTRRLHPAILKTSMVAMPVLGGMLLLLGSK